MQQASWSEVSRKLYINHAQFSYRKQLSRPHSTIATTSLPPPHGHTASYIQIKMRCKIPKWAKGNRKKAVRKFIYYSHERYFFLLVLVLVRLWLWSMTKKRRERKKRSIQYSLVFFYSNFLFHSFLGIFGQLAMVLVEY